MTSMAARQYAAGKAYGIRKDGSAPSYLEQEVLSWSKEKLILKLYDLFIVSAKRGDTIKMGRVLIELMSSLNFDYEEPSSRLYRLYEFCQRCIMQKNINHAVFIMTELRNTWAKAFSLENI